MPVTVDWLNRIAVTSCRGTVAPADHGERQAGLMRRRSVRESTPRSEFAGFRFPPDVIILAVRWYLRYGLSYRDVEELLAETGHRGRPCHGLSVGAAVYSAADRCGQAVSTRRRRSLVCG